MQVTPEQIVGGTSGVSGAMGSSITSLKINNQLRWGYAVQATYTGSPVGTLAIQASNDGVNWSTITITSTSISGSGSTMFNMSQELYPYAQLIWTPSSGSGTLYATVYTKGL